MYFTDYHVHTNFSGDADRSASPRSVALRAVSLGMDEIMFTDHLDFKYKTLVPTYLRLDEYAQAILSLADLFKDKIAVKLGVELGLTPEIAHLARSVTDKYPFEFIILSIHDIKDKGVYFNYFDNREKQESYDGYFAQLRQVLDANPPFCVVGHLDYIERYADFPDRTVRYAEHAEAIDDIFKHLIRTGKGLEVNTSGHRYGLGHANPKPEMLKRYKELGGEILTLGSDSHGPEYLGADIKNERELLKSLGFKYFARYHNMKPEMLPL